MPDSAFTPFYRGGSGEPLVLIHGFTDTWRTWELVIPELESRFDVFAPTLMGHAGGPELPAEFTHDALGDALERSLDAAGIDTAHVVGNSLGGYVALKLAERDRARSVTALAPAGGFDDGGAASRELALFFGEMHELVVRAAPFADQAMATAEGRRRATLMTVVNYEHIPADLLAHQLRGSAQAATLALLEQSLTHGFELVSERVTCPVRIVWGEQDQVLPWPAAAKRFHHLLPEADWVELPGVGHCPQLDIPAQTATLIAEWAGAVSS